MSFDNGIYDFSTMRFRKHQKNNFITFSMKYNYEETNDPKIKQEILAFFEDLFTNKDIRSYILKNMS